MDVRQRRTLQIGRELLEVFVGLTRKPDDDVRPDRRVGMRARMPSTSRAYCSIVYGRRIASSTRLLAC